MTTSADPEQIEPAVAAAVLDTTTVEESPAVAAAMVYESLAHSIGVAFQNAVAAQHLDRVALNAATNQAVAEIMSEAASASAGERTVPNLASLARPAAAGIEESTPSRVSAVIEQLDRFVLDEAPRFADAVVEAAHALTTALAGFDLLAFLRSVDELAVGLTAASASGHHDDVRAQLQVLTDYAQTRLRLVASVGDTVSDTIVDGTADTTVAVGDSTTVTVEE